MSGYVRIHRSLYDHPAFKAFDEACVFAWMISRAAWRATRVRYKSTSIDLERGEFAMSTRDMASIIDWSEARVRRFLKRLAYDEMIRLRNDARVSVVTICNYERFQASAAEGDAPATQQRRSSVPEIDAASDATLDTASVGNNEMNSPGTESGDASNDAPATQQRSENDAQNKEGKERKNIQTQSPLLRERGARKRATRLPDDWILPPTWRRWAETERPDLDIDETAATFRDHWIGESGQHATKANWLATWRNWVRRERANPNRPRDGPQTFVAQGQQDNADIVRGARAMANQLTEQNDGRTTLDPNRGDYAAIPHVHHAVPPDETTD